jgi:hypothetical protein
MEILEFKPVWLDLADCPFSKGMACLVYPAVASDSIINELQ